MYLFTWYQVHPWRARRKRRFTKITTWPSLLKFLTSSIIGSISSLRLRPPVPASKTNGLSKRMLLVHPFSLVFVYYSTFRSSFIRPSVRPSVRPSGGLWAWVEKWKNERFEAFCVCACVGRGMGCWVWIGIGCPCPPVRNDIVTPRHLFCFCTFVSFYLCLSSIQMAVSYLDVRFLSSLKPIEVLHTCLLMLCSRITYPYYLTFTDNPNPSLLAVWRKHSRLSFVCCKTWRGIIDMSEGKFEKLSASYRWFQLN